MSKQADVLMLFYLFFAEQLVLLFEQLGYPFSPDMIPKNLSYSLDRSPRGSTLTRIVHSWLLARSDRPRSWHLLQRALDSNLVDIQGGTMPEGVHTGAMAGTIELVQRCYMGIETRASRPITAAPITIAYHGHFWDMAAGQSFEFHLLKPEACERDEKRRTSATSLYEQAVREILQ